MMTDKMAILTKELGWSFLFKPDNIKEIAGWHANDGLQKWRHINDLIRLSNFPKLFQ